MAMPEYINLDAALDETTLRDWYISSTDGKPPIWTEEHVEELLGDFYVIPKGAAFIDNGAALQWFKISECPPAVQQDVLLYFGSYLKMVAGGRYTDRANTTWYANADGEHYTHCYSPAIDADEIQPPTYWMPLPAPPNNIEED